MSAKIPADVRKRLQPLHRIARRLLNIIDSIPEDEAVGLLEFELALGNFIATAADLGLPTKQSNLIDFDRYISIYPDFGRGDLVNSEEETIDEEQSHHSYLLKVASDQTEYEGEWRRIVWDKTFKKHIRSLVEAVSVVQHVYLMNEDQEPAKRDLEKSLSTIDHFFPSKTRKSLTSAELKKIEARLRRGDCLSVIASLLHRNESTLRTSKEVKALIEEIEDEKLLR